MKRNLKQYMGVCLLLILSMVSGHTALAANTWKMAAKELTANEQTTLSIELANSDAVNAFQFTITLPEGLLLMGNPVLNVARTDGHTLSWTPLQGNKYLCVVYSLLNADLKGNSGELLSIPVLVDPAYAGGQVTMTDLLLTNKKAENLAITAELGALTLKKDLKRIQLIVTGLTQTVSETKAEILLTTIPDLTGFTISYSDGDRRKAGVFEVIVTREEDEDYLAVNEKFRMVIVDKQKAAITSPTASAINAGQRLSQSLLSGGSATFDNSPVPGKFVWQKPEQEVTTTGDYTALFVPTDNSRYANVEVSVPVTVNTLYNVYLLPQVGGSLKVEGEHADQTYVAGQTLTVTALPDPNYEFVRWNDNDKSNPRTITVSSNMTLMPIFERPIYTVNVPSVLESRGSLTVTCDGIALKPGVNACLKGSTILAQVTPKTGYTVQSLTIGDVAQTKYTVVGHVSIEVSIVQIKEDSYAVQTELSGNGSGTIRLFKENGETLLPGASLAKGSKFIAICAPEPGSDLEGLEVSGATLANGKYTVIGETKLTAKFTKHAYTVTQDVRGEGKLVLSPQQTTYSYGDEITIAATADLDRLVVNGKALQAGDKYTITGPTTVFARFLDRQEINPQYINTAVQSYVFNNQYKHFDVWASDIYSYLGFDVSYSPLDANQTAPVNVGDYNVHITREADQNYKAFNLSLPNALKVTKAKLRVKAAPASAAENDTEQHGATEPAYGSITIEQDANKTYLHKFTYYPTLEDAANYDPVVYYLSTSTTKYELSVGNATTLKSTEEQGYVLVTNGNMVVENLTAIPMGTKLTLQAIAKSEYRFKEWKHGDTVIKDNPIEISLEGNLTYEPVFEGKTALTATLTQNVFDYTEGTPNVEISVTDGVNEVTGVQLRFFAEEACTTAIEPTNVKNEGTYYVQAYRAEDDKYQELKQVFSFTIKPVKPSAITWPTASDIVAGETLAASTLIGGNAGSIPGSFAWKEGQTISGAGEKTPTVVFTPLDPNYQSCEGTVTLNVLSTASSTTEIKEPVKPSDPTPTEPTNPTEPTEPTEPDEPSYTSPVVAERTPTTAVITWDKVEGAASYKLFLYAKKGDVTPLKTYEFDSKGQLLKASAISFNLTDLEEGKAYYVKTVAYNAWGQAMVEKGIELSATPTAIEQIAAAVQVTTSKGMIHVELATPLSIRIVAMNGLPLFEQVDVAGHLDIPVMNAGVYVVILSQGHEALLQKVIVR